MFLPESGPWAVHSCSLRRRVWVSVAVAAQKPGYDFPDVQADGSIGVNAEPCGMEQVTSEWPWTLRP